MKNLVMSSANMAGMKTFPVLRRIWSLYLQSCYFWCNIEVWYLVKFVLLKISVKRFVLFMWNILYEYWVDLSDTHTHTLLFNCRKKPLLVFKHGSLSCFSCRFFSTRKDRWKNVAWRRDHPKDVCEVKLMKTVHAS